MACASWLAFVCRSCGDSRSEERGTEMDSQFPVEYSRACALSAATILVVCWLWIPQVKLLDTSPEMDSPIPETVLDRPELRPIHRKNLCASSFAEVPHGGSVASNTKVALVVDLQNHNTALCRHHHHYHHHRQQQQLKQSIQLTDLVCTKAQLPHRQWLQSFQQKSDDRDEE